MSVNSSFNISPHFLHELCLSRVTISIFAAFIVGNILLLPLFLLVLFVGYQQWRKRRFGSAAAMTSHSDVLTFNMVVLELICVIGSLVFCYGTFKNEPTLRNSGLYIFSIISPGQTLFHLLTCVERYLAVVHPVAFLGLRQARGVRIRNVSIGCVWLFCLGTLGLTKTSSPFYIVHNFLFLVSASVVMLFCSFSVLYILTRPGPGDVTGDSERVDQSKQRAFYTVMAIMGALLIRFSSSLISLTIYVLFMATFSDRPICLMMWSVACFSVPSSLVLPLLFLHRAGKSPGCKHVAESA